MCSETQTEKTSHFFPLFLEHLHQEEEEEAHPRAGSSTTFTLPQVLTNYTVRLSFLQPEEQEAAGDCTASAWHDGCHTRCRYGSEIVPISVSRHDPLQPCSFVAVGGEPRRRSRVKLSGHSPQLKNNSQELIKRGKHQTWAQSWAQGVKRGWQPGLGISHSSSPTEMGLQQFGIMGR